MDNQVKQQLIEKIENEIGIDTLFKDLGLEQVTQNGGNIYCVCPFHKGADNPTGFSWNIEKQFGYCFTQCHKSYSLFDIVMAVNDFDFTEAALYLADLATMDIDFKPLANKAESSDNRTFLKQVKRAKENKIESGFKSFDKSILNEFEPYLHTVLRKEGFDNDVRKYFSLGYCRSGYFKDRITIPVDAADGSIITVSGRSILPDEEIEFSGLKKYLIYSNTDKSKTLYNISRAIPYIDLLNEVIVVEGFKSVWRLHQWGIRNAVAVMGSTISDEQKLILLKLNADVIVCGDKDEAGNKLNKEVLKKLEKYTTVKELKMFELDIPNKSSVAEISKEQFSSLYEKLASNMS